MYHYDLEKRGDLRGCDPIVTRLRLPAFLNFHGSIFRYILQAILF